MPLWACWDTSTSPRPTRSNQISPVGKPGGAATAHICNARCSTSTSSVSALFPFEPRGRARWRLRCAETVSLCPWSHRSIENLGRRRHPSHPGLLLGDPPQRIKSIRRVSEIGECGHDHGSMLKVTANAITANVFGLHEPVICARMRNIPHRWRGPRN